MGKPKTKNKASSFVSKGPNCILSPVDYVRSKHRIYGLFSEWLTPEQQEALVLKSKAQPCH